MKKSKTPQKAKSRSTKDLPLKKKHNGASGGDGKTVQIQSKGRLTKILSEKYRNGNKSLPVKPSSHTAPKETGTLMVSVSGIRGIIGESLTPEVITKYAAAFGTWCNGGTVVVGRDSRVSGEMVKTLVTGTLLAAGCKIVDIGIVPTPTVEITVNDMNAHGGIAITASHNPIQWNALKLIGPRGRFLTQSQMNEVLEIADRKSTLLATWDRIGKINYYDHAIQNHIDHILELEYIDVEALRKRNFKVVVDCVNGAGGVIVPRLLKELGCNVVVINEEPHGVFPRNPEPSVDNLKALEETVRQHQAHIGFAVDPDVDRLALVNEKGQAIGEELTLMIATDLVLSRKKGPVVVNASTTMGIDQIASMYGVQTHHTRIGEINVSIKMEEIDSVIGGEGNGGVILPEIHLGRDACTGIALALQYVLQKNKPFSECVAELPYFIMKKDKIELHDIDADAVMTKILKDQKKGRVDTVDGVKIIFEDGWIHFRKSNTEPIMRIIAEARTQERLDNMIRSFTSYFH